MHSRFSVTDARMPRTDPDTSVDCFPNKKKGCPCYQPDWGNHAVSHLCRLHRAKGAKYCSRADPCDVCATWPDNIWTKSDESIKRKQAKDKRKKRSHSTPEHDKKNVSDQLPVAKPQTVSPEVSSKLPTQLGPTLPVNASPVMPSVPADVSLQVPPPLPLKPAPSIFGQKIVQLKADKTDKFPTTDHGTDLTSIFACRPLYKPPVINIMPISRNQESEDEEKKCECGWTRQSCYDKLKLERKQAAR